MNRSQRNKFVRRDYNTKIADLVTDFIKKKRKSSKRFKSDIKSKKFNSKFKKKLLKKKTSFKKYSNITLRSKKRFSKNLRSFLLTRSIRIYCEKKKKRPNVITSNAFDFQRFNNEII